MLQFFSWIILLLFSSTSDRLFDKLFADLEGVLSLLSVLLRSLLLFCFHHLFKLAQTEEIRQTSVFHLEWHFLKYWIKCRIEWNNVKTLHFFAFTSQQSRHTGQIVKTTQIKSLLSLSDLWTVMQNELMNYVFIKNYTIRNITSKHWISILLVLHIKKM